MLPSSGTDTIEVQPRQACDTFLVSTEDIVEILDIVIGGLRSLHDKHLSTGCLSAILSDRTRPRAGTTNEKGIITHYSKFAGPATTISAVKSVFSAAGYAKDHGNSRALCNNKSTIMTRQSVTECD